MGFSFLFYKTAVEATMDEMKINVTSKFMRGIVSKILQKTIYKNTGVKPTIQISELLAEMKDGKIHFHINADGEINDSVLLKVNNLLDTKD